jgi:hypothetical protein
MTMKEIDLHGRSGWGVEPAKRNDESVSLHSSHRDDQKGARGDEPQGQEGQDAVEYIQTLNISGGQNDLKEMQAGVLNSQPKSDEDSPITENASLSLKESFAEGQSPFIPRHILPRSTSQPLSLKPVNVQVLSQTPSWNGAVTVSTRRSHNTQMGLDILGSPLLQPMSPLRQPTGRASSANCAPAAGGRGGGCSGSEGGGAGMLVDSSSATQRSSAETESNVGSHRQIPAGVCGAVLSPRGESGRESAHSTRSGRQGGKGPKLSILSVKTLSGSKELREQIYSRINQEFPHFQGPVDSYLNDQVLSLTREALNEGFAAGRDGTRNRDAVGRDTGYNDTLTYGQVERSWEKGNRHKEERSGGKIEYAKQIACTCIRCGRVFASGFVVQKLNIRVIQRDLPY